MSLSSVTPNIIKIPRWKRLLILYTPFVLFAVFTLFLAIPATRSTASWTLRENNPVEVATFFCFMAAGILGIKHFTRLKKTDSPRTHSYFYLLCGLIFIFIAMEEVAWRQCFIGFETPEYVSRINGQNQITLHNLHGLHGKSEIFRLIAGLSGLIGIFIYTLPKWTLVGIPPVLFPWFLVVTIHASIDMYNDFFPIGEMFDAYIHRTAELVEFLISIAVLLYIVLNARRVIPDSGASDDTGMNE